MSPSGNRRYCAIAWPPAATHRADSAASALRSRGLFPRHFFFELSKSMKYFCSANLARSSRFSLSNSSTVLASVGGAGSRGVSGVSGVVIVVLRRVVAGKRSRFLSMILALPAGDRRGATHTEAGRRLRTGELLAPHVAQDFQPERRLVAHRRRHGHQPGHAVPLKPLSPAIHHRIGQAMLPGEPPAPKGAGMELLDDLELEARGVL